MGTSDTITLGHGSGGRRTRKLIKELFLAHWGNPFLDALGDSASLGSLKGDLYFTTDSYVVQPIFFPGGDIGRLAVAGTVNDLAVSGAIPLYLSASFVLEEGLLFSDLERIVVSMKETAEEAGVLLVTGDTKVVERGSADRLFITTSGVGVRHPRFRAGSSRICPGDVVIVNGNLGEHGLAVLLAREALPFKANIKSDCAPLAALIGKVLDAADVHFMRDLTRGGLAVVLNEIAEGQGFGIALDESMLPISEEVKSVSELVGFDPMYIANEGKAVFFIGKDNAEAALSLMRSEPLGSGASIVGEVTGDYPGRVFLKTSSGGLRVVDVPEADQLPRIC